MSASEEQKRKYILILWTSATNMKNSKKTLFEEFLGALHGEHKYLNTIQKQSVYDITSYGRREIKFFKGFDNRERRIRALRDILQCEHENNEA